ncbi:MAG: hypothetical protein M9932_15455 [Xanthobacteraceae bacterium]|nr:hypothetical protein [Xanthobacteraceae bacterium]
MPQGTPAPSRLTQRRYRTALLRGDPHEAAEQRSPGSSYAVSSNRPRRTGGIERNEPSRIEAERCRLELKHLQEEVLALAREFRAIYRPDVEQPAASPPQRSYPREFKAAAQPPIFARNDGFSSNFTEKTEAPFSRRDTFVAPSPARNRTADFPPPRPERDRRPTARASEQEFPIDPVGSENRVLSTHETAPPPGIIQDVGTAAKTPTARKRGTKIILAVEVLLLIVLMIVGTGLIAPRLWSDVSWLAPARQEVADILARVPWPAPKAEHEASAASAPNARAAPTMAMPDTYGIYAVNNGQLTALDALPIRIPDARVSISTTFTKPAPAPFVDGRLSFLAYHRDLATHVPESASVRVVAQVMQATAFTGGKPTAMAIEDTWAVRGGAIDLRIAPVPGNQEMVAIRAADPDFTLPPGRYVLMFKNQAYDFSVAGTVTDTAQCLERSDLQDRSVYSECRELPSKPLRF